jgi:hypothetical protein
MKRLTIEHNHGVLILRDAETFTRDGYGYAAGIVEGGGQTSRLFHATSYTPFPVGVRKEWIIGSSKPRERKPDDWYVSAVFCG